MRKRLYHLLERDPDSPDTEQRKENIQELNRELKALRKELKTCERVAVRSNVVLDMVDQMQHDDQEREQQTEIQKSAAKEDKQYGRAEDESKQQGWETTSEHER